MDKVTDIDKNHLHNFAIYIQLKKQDCKDETIVEAKIPLMQVDLALACGNEKINKYTDREILRLNTIDDICVRVKSLYESFGFVVRRILISIDEDTYDKFNIYEPVKEEYTNDTAE